MHSKERREVKILVERQLSSNNLIIKLDAGDAVLKCNSADVSWSWSEHRILTLNRISLNEMDFIINSDRADIIGSDISDNTTLQQSTLISDDQVIRQCMLCYDALD